jgi:hypothetical protein
VTTKDLTRNEEVGQLPLMMIEESYMMMVELARKIRERRVGK